MALHVHFRSGTRYHPLLLCGLLLIVGTCVRPSDAFTGQSRKFFCQWKECWKPLSQPCRGMEPAAATTTVSGTPTPEDLIGHATRLQPLAGLAFFPLGLIERRLEHLYALFPRENATSMVCRVPDLLCVEPNDLAARVAERQVQLAALLPACRPLRLMAKAPILVFQDFDSQIKSTAERLEWELPGMDLARVVCPNPAVLTRAWDTVLFPQIVALRAIFPQENLGRIIMRRPDLLSRDAAGRLREGMEGLARHLPLVKVEMLAARQPDILALEPRQVAARIKHLEALFPAATRAEVAKMINRKPSLLLTSVERVLRPKLARLRNILGSAAAQELCQTMPSILSRDLEQVEARLKLLRAPVPGQDLVRFLRYNPAFLSSAPGAVGARLTALQSVFPRGVELGKMLIREPQLYAEDVDVLALKLAEVHAATRLSKEEVVERLRRDARFLLVPYGRLASRLRFLKALENVGAEPWEWARQGDPGGEGGGEGGVRPSLQRINLGSMASMPLGRFLHLYPLYPFYLLHELGRSPTPHKEGSNVYQLEKAHSQMLWRDGGLRDSPVKQINGNGGRPGRPHSIGRKENMGEEKQMPRSF